MKLISWIILLSVTLVLALFAIANRHGVTLHFDPLPLELQAPVYILLMAAMLAGMVVGGWVVWWRQGRWRKEARNQRRTAERLSREAEAKTGGTQTQLPAMRDGTGAAAG